MGCASTWWQVPPRRQVEIGIIAKHQSCICRIQACTADAVRACHTYSAGLCKEVGLAASCGDEEIEGSCGQCDRINR